MSTPEPLHRPKPQPELVPDENGTYWAPKLDVESLAEFDYLESLEGWAFHVRGQGFGGDR